MVIHHQSSLENPSPISHSGNNSDSLSLCKVLFCIFFFFLRGEEKEYFLTEYFKFD